MHSRALSPRLCMTPLSAGVIIPSIEQACPGAQPVNLDRKICGFAATGAGSFWRMFDFSASVDPQRLRVPHHARSQLGAQRGHPFEYALRLCLRGREYAAFVDEQRV